MKIDFNKEYVTSRGEEVKLFDEIENVVFGAVKTSMSGWVSHRWTENGESVWGPGGNLVEKKPSPWDTNITVDFYSGNRQVEEPNLRHILKNYYTIDLFTKDEQNHYVGQYLDKLEKLVKENFGQKVGGV